MDKSRRRRRPRVTTSYNNGDIWTQESSAPENGTDIAKSSLFFSRGFHLVQMKKFLHRQKENLITFLFQSLHEMPFHFFLHFPPFSFVFHFTTKNLCSLCKKSPLSKEKATTYSNHGYIMSLPLLPFFVVVVLQLCRQY